MLYLEVKIKYNYACTDFFFQNSDHRDIMNLVNVYEYFWVDTLYMQHLFDLIGIANILKRAYCMMLTA